MMVPMVIVFVVAMFMMPVIVPFVIVVVHLASLRLTQLYRGMRLARGSSCESRSVMTCVRDTLTGVGDRKTV